MDPDGVVCKVGSEVLFIIENNVILLVERFVQNVRKPNYTL
jgi:hypothetical protein